MPVDVAPASARGCSGPPPRRPGMRYVSYSPDCRCLALPLLVPRVRADDHNPAMPADDPALAADLLHTRLDLHDVFSSVLKSALSGGGHLLVAVNDPAATQVV